MEPICGELPLVAPSAVGESVIAKTKERARHNRIANGPKLDWFINMTSE